MRLHRFYVDPEKVKLEHTFWLQDQRLVHQWNKVLRFQVGQQMTLFDGVEHERLYKLLKIDDQGAHLELVTDFVRQTPARQIHLLWSLLKKDKNDWVIQKCTELGVSNFVPLYADRSEKTGFEVERAQKIMIEAAEQCGRSDIPAVREPITVQEAVEEYAKRFPLYIAELNVEAHQTFANQTEAGALIGPEGGWSDAEKQLFQDHRLPHLKLSDLTLRAETACVVVASKLLA